MHLVNRLKERAVIAGLRGIADPALVAPDLEEAPNGDVDEIVLRLAEDAADLLGHANDFKRKSGDANGLADRVAYWGRVVPSRRAR